MGLLDEIRAESHSAKPCKIGRYLLAMTKEDAKDLQTALDDRNIPVQHIEKVLNRNGFPVGHAAIGKHRAGTCCCVSR